MVRHLSGRAAPVTGGGARPGGAALAVKYRPGNHLEALAADRGGQFILRVNQMPETWLGGHTERSASALIDNPNGARKSSRRTPPGCYFGTTTELWLGLQRDYELDVARDTAAAEIEREVLPRAR